MVDISDMTTEVGYFALDAPYWNNKDVLERNLTITAIDEMIRRKYFGGFMNSGVSKEMMLVTVLSVLICVGFLFIFLIHKGWIRIQVRPRDASQVTNPRNAVRQDTIEI